MKRQFFLVAAVTLIAGCGTIEHSSKIDQPVGQPLVAGVGDVVIRVKRQRNLENAYGGADIFGRKTDEGFSELRFAGVEVTGEIVLYRKDIDIITNETVLSRNRTSTTTGTANTRTTGRYYGTAESETKFSATTTMPASDFHVVVPAQSIPIRLAPGESKIPMEGYVVEITNATNSSLEYRINKL